MIMKKKILILGVALAAFVGGSGVALATPGNTPHPTATANQTAKAGSALLKACSENGWKALYTPIPVGTAAVANDPATPAVDESKATVYVFASRSQCKATVNAGLPIGLLNGLPAATISILAPANFPPTAAPPASVTPPATAALANVVNGSATAPFTLNVVGSGFTANADVSALLSFRDGHSVVVAVGKADANGALTYPVAGACVKSQIPSSVTLLQFPAGPAATATVPNTVCPGV
jgi:hypothetical protein